MTYRTVETEDDAARLRFLGSPTVRVDGCDVEAGAEDRSDFGMECRVYFSSDGLPASAWIRDALRSSEVIERIMHDFGGCMRALMLLGGIVASACACQGRAGTEPRGEADSRGAAAAGSTAAGPAAPPALWESIDKKFKGCEGG